MTRVIVRGGDAPGNVPAMDVSSHTTLFPAGGGVPDWIHLLPAGTFSGTDGRGPYHLRDPQAVITASMAEGKLPLDENHATELAHATGAPGPARGWIVEMQARPDGIWGKIDWNESGKALMTDRAYKGVSPVYAYAKDGTVTRILSGALTNKPNLTLTALHTSGDSMDKKAICTALGIAETASDEDVLTALNTAKAKVTTLEGTVAELKRTTAPTEQVVTLQTQLDTIKSERAIEKATAFIDTAIKAGKPIVAVRQQYIDQHVAKPAETEAMVNGLVSINAGGTGGRAAPPAGAEGTAAMTAEDLAICTAMGTDPKKLAEFRAKKTTEGSVA